MKSSLEECNAKFIELPFSSLQPTPRASLQKLYTFIIKSKKFNDYFSMFMSQSNFLDPIWVS